MKFAEFSYERPDLQAAMAQLDAVSYTHLFIFLLGILCGFLADWIFQKKQKTGLDL